jgi:hypothetical protein
MTLKLRHFLAPLGVLIATGCADIPTTPNAGTAVAGAALSSSAPNPYGEAKGLTPFTCTFGIRDQTGGYRFRRSTVYFPVSELHPEGVRRAYDYRAYSGGVPTLIAWCPIPATARAEERMNRLFKVEGRHKRGISVASILPEVTVIACQYGGLYPDCEAAPPPPEVDPCYAYGQCGGGGQWPWDGTEPTTPTPTPTPAPEDAFKTGPLAWTACILTVLNSGYSVYQVAGAFETWWGAQKEFESAERTYNSILANPDGVSLEVQQVWEFRVEYHRNRRDDAVGAVREKVGGSYWGLLFAGAACGAAAFLPTP